MVFLDSQSKAFKNQLKVFMKLTGKSPFNLFGRHQVEIALNGSQVPLYFEGCEVDFCT